MFTFKELAGAHAKVVGKTEAGKSIIVVTVPGVTTGKEAKAALASAGYADGYAAKHNWAWGGQEYGGFKRHVGDAKKAKAIVKAINDAHKDAPKKAKPAKAKPVKDDELAELLKEYRELNALLAKVLGC